MLQRKVSLLLKTKLEARTEEQLDELLAALVRSLESAQFEVTIADVDDEEGQQGR